MKIQLFLSILLLVIFTVPFVSVSNPKQIVKIEVVEVVLQYYQYLNDGEIDIANGMLSPKFNEFSPNGSELMYFQELETYLDEGYQYTLADFDVRIVGTTAIVTNRMMTREKQSKPNISINSVLTTILEKQNGVWKILHQHHT